MQRDSYKPETDWSKHRKRRWTFSASWKDIQRWKQFKEEQGISLSALIRTACDHYIEQERSEVEAE